MKKLLTLLVFSIQLTTLAQKDSLQLGSRYSEDQIYINIAYNQFYNQPETVGKTGFSYGFSTGFIKDFILNKRGSLAFALGVGYGFDTFNHQLKVAEINSKITFNEDNLTAANKLSIHNLEFPLQFRWRNATASKYKFWRIYIGIKISYNISNTFSYQEATRFVSLKNRISFNSWQYGVTFSAGYDVFNMYFYYGLTSVLKNTFIETEKIDTKILKFGLVFYLL